MKNQIKSFILVALSICMAAPAWSQASTQGKEFWVSSSLVCSPDKATPTPYIAVSAEKECTVTIQGGLNNDINITQKVAAGSWSEFGNPSKTQQTNPAVGPVCVDMDASKWYPTSMSNANNVYTLAGKQNMYGLHITATEKISVYVILASTHSMDASNILPITALGSEYYTQDYWSKVKSDFADAVGLTTILGTEDNTIVEIIPNGNTYDGHKSGQLYTVNLKKGETYYMVTEKSDRLAGTHIREKNGKKIAIYCGVPITNVPTGIAARDCLFEQPMPIEYWGTQFIATRSLQKNGNLIGITATVNGTEIKVDGYTQNYINAGETYYILLQGPAKPADKNAGESPIDLILTQDAAFIETSCPCAVYSYDTGNSFKGQNDGDSEIDNGKGDPSSVWVSPIQQKINKITFGTCYTEKTKDHFLNVVTETATCNNTKLTAIHGASTIDKTSLLSWTPVPGNPAYSYARAKIGDSSTSTYSVFRLENEKGFIATVYGNGEDESYAYSAGSAAVEQGVKVEGEVFVNGSNDGEFCLGTSNSITLNFDAKVGTDEVNRVDWDFGDGISQEKGEIVTTHNYTSPGWYDVSARLYGHQVCTTESEQLLGTVNFTIRIVRPVKKISTRKECEPMTYTGPEETTEVKTFDCDSIVTYTVKHYKESEKTLPIVIGNDSVYVNGQWYYPDIEPKLPADGIIKWEEENEYHCKLYVTCPAKIVTCLDLAVTNDSANQYVCYGDTVLDLPFNLYKGDMGDSYLSYTYKSKTVKKKLEIISNYFVLPVKMDPGKYKAQISVEDTVCDRTLTFPIDLCVYYPDNIFKLKYGNTLAVYRSGQGGNLGWEFDGFQWYRNGVEIPGATLAAYEFNESDKPGDEYYVALKLKGGKEYLVSCPSVPVKASPANPNPAPQKIVTNQHIYILLDDSRIYDIYGQRVR